MQIAKLHTAHTPQTALSLIVKLLYKLKERFDLSANLDANNNRKRHDSSSGSSDDDEEEEDGGAEFRRKKRRSEGGRHARERLQETPSYTGGVSRDAKERQGRRCALSGKVAKAS